MIFINSSLKLRDPKNKDNSNDVFFFQILTLVEIYMSELQKSIKIRFIMNNKEYK